MRNGFKFKYVSASGQVLDLSGGGIDADGSKLPSWSFEAVTLNGRIYGVKKQMPVYSLPLIVVADSAQAGIDAKNALYEIPALDIDNRTPGRLYFNDWYIEGYMTASEASNFWQLKRAAQYVVKFTATSPKWIRETERSYTEQYSPIGIFLDYPHDFPYDYGVSRQIFTIENSNYTDSPVMLRIFGDVKNPRITINNNEYRVNVDLDAGEYIEINGFNYTVEIVRANGKRENAFQYIAGDFRKDSGSYIFQPIPAGVSEVIWSGEFDFDIVSFELRSEPRWS